MVDIQIRDLFAQITRYPLIGVIILILLRGYNRVTWIFLRICPYIEKTAIPVDGTIHPTAIICPWGVRIQQGVTIGKESVIKPRTEIGSHSCIDNLCVLGNAGFQVYRFKKHRLPIIHTGKVVIGERVIIGERTCIDRGVFGGKTSIGSNSSVGSNTIIGHNIQIGSRCSLGNYVAIGGKTKIGDRVFIGDHVTIANRITIESGSHIPAGSIISRNVSRDQK